MGKYLTFDCYGTLLNEEATYAAIETVADKISLHPTFLQCFLALAIRTSLPSRVSITVLNARRSSVLRLDI